VYGGVEGAGWRVDMTWQEPWKTEESREDTCETTFCYSWDVMWVPSDS
jgi:hypothetical protein